MWFGDEATGRRHIDRIFSVGRQVSCKTATMSYLALQTMADSEFPHGRRYYTKSGYFQDFSDQVVGQMVDALASIPGQHTQIELAYLGGRRVGSAHRKRHSATGARPLSWNVLADWERPRRRPHQYHVGPESV